MFGFIFSETETLWPRDFPMGKPPGSISLFPRAVAHAYRIRPDVLRMTSKALQDVICACLLPAKPRSRVYTACRCGTLKTQEWKTRDREKYAGGKGRTGNAGPNFTAVVKSRTTVYGTRNG